MLYDFLWSDPDPEPDPTKRESATLLSRELPPTFFFFGGGGVGQLPLLVGSGSKNYNFLGQNSGSECKIINT